MDEQNPPRPSAGWYPDPFETGRQRYWNGSEWGFQASTAPRHQEGARTASAVFAAERSQVTFGEAIRYGFRQYAKSTGRATRAEYWWFVLFVFLAAVAFSVVDSILGTDPLLGNLWTLATVLPSLGVACRRLRDAGSSPWNVLWGLLPIVGSLILLVKLCRPSVPVRSLHLARGEAVGSGVIR